VTEVARMARWAGTALAGLSTRDLAGALAVVLLLVLAGCWVITNEDRARRFADILSAWRGTRPDQADKAPRRKGKRAASE
jgi:hypothetical protein